MQKRSSLFIRRSLQVIIHSSLSDTFKIGNIIIPAQPTLFIPATPCIESTNVHFCFPQRSEPRTQLVYYLADGYMTEVCAPNGVCVFSDHASCPSLI